MKVKKAEENILAWKVWAGAATVLAPAPASTWHTAGVQKLSQEQMNEYMNEWIREEMRTLSVKLVHSGNKLISNMG